MKLKLLKNILQHNSLPKLPSWWVIATHLKHICSSNWIIPQFSGLKIQHWNHLATFTYLYQWLHSLKLTHRPCKIVGFWILSWNGIHLAYFPRRLGSVSSRAGKNPQSQVDQSKNQGIRISPSFKQQNLRQFGEDSRDQMLETNIRWTNVKWFETKPLVASSKKI